MITNSDFHDNTSNGVGMGSGAPLLSAIDIVDFDLLPQRHRRLRARAAPPQGSGSGDISLFNFLGDALIKNVTVHGGDNAIPVPTTMPTSASRSPASFPAPTKSPIPSAASCSTTSR